MKNIRIAYVLLVILALTFAALPVGAQEEVVVECGPNAVLTNGAMVYFNLLPGTYKFTVLGIDGFDPVMALLDESLDVIECSDDAVGAAEYSANLPTTGIVETATTNSQVIFEYQDEDARDFAVAVGGYGGTSGQFVLLAEPFSVAEEDGVGEGTGDPISLLVTPNLVDGLESVTLYMLGIDDALDPYFVLIDANGILTDDAGVDVVCDDAGSTSCWREGVDLSEASIIIDGVEVVADNFDASMQLDWALFGDDVAAPDSYLNWRLSSFGQTTTGDYVVAIHLGIGEADTASTDSVEEAYELTCRTSGVELTGDVGTTGLVSCPANCTGGSIWGTDVYTDDSIVCIAAIHAGAITADGGAFHLTILEGQASYAGSTQNGVASSLWGSWSRSFAVVGLE